MRSFSRDGERWELELDETNVVSRRYVDGELVDDELIERASPIVAKWEFDRLCHARRAEGFLEDTASATRASEQAGARDQAALEAALLDTPDDLSAHLVPLDDWAKRWARRTR